MNTETEVKYLHVCGLYSGIANKKRSNGITKEKKLF